MVNLGSKTSNNPNMYKMRENLASRPKLASSQKLDSDRPKATRKRMKKCETGKWYHSHAATYSLPRGCSSVVQSTIGTFRIGLHKHVCLGIWFAKQSLVWFYSNTLAEFFGAIAGPLFTYFVVVRWRAGSCVGVAASFDT